jgi:tripartite tricarboxylate transporter TctB family protein
MKLVNIVIALLLLVAVVPLWVISARFPDTAIAFPRFVLVVIAILAASILVENLFPGRKRRVEGEGRQDLRCVARPLGAFTAGVAGVYLMSHFGFFPAMGAFAFLLFPVLKVISWRTYIMTVVALLIFTYIVFAILLGVPLTAGFGGQG